MINCDECDEPLDSQLHYAQHLADFHDAPGALAAMQRYDDETTETVWDQP